MSVKEQIESLKKKIESKKSMLRGIDCEITRLESQKRMASSSKTMGLSFMASGTMRPLGTYKYLSGSRDESFINSTIVRKRATQSSLSWEIRGMERDLKDLESKYASLPEAKLYSTKYGIHIEGDEKETDLLEPLRKTMEEYAETHKKINESPDVAKYKKLKAELDEAIQTSALPEATDKNIEELNQLKRRLRMGFDYEFVNGRLYVGSDFISRQIQIASDEMKNQQRKIDDNQKRRDEFEPTFMGKILRSVRKKQQAELEEKIKYCDLEYRTSYGEAEADYKYYSEVKDKYIVPSQQIKELHITVSDLASVSPLVYKYVSGAEKYDRPIDENTILKDIEVGDIPSFLIRGVQTYLDKTDQRLTRETLLQAICESEYHRELAEQIKKVVGYTPKEKQAESEKQ